MDIDELSRHALGILGAVEAAHAHDLVHCDLKPENVFVDPAFGAKLFDFGLVRRAGEPELRADVTQEEAPAGTPEYMSPEQCEARADIDRRSDIYALGVILYELLSGAPPFWGKPAEVQQSHRSRRPPASVAQGPPGGCPRGRYRAMPRQGSIPAVRRRHRAPTRDHGGPRGRAGPPRGGRDGGRNGAGAPPPARA